MHPIIFSIGPLTVYSFGVMLAVAFLVAGNVVNRIRVPAEVAKPARAALNLMLEVVD